MSDKINNFITDDEWSKTVDSFWQAFYKKAFPCMVNMMSCPGRYESQRRGIDRVIMFSNGRIIKVEEKARREASKDILLEYIANDKTNAPGWIEKDLEVDYLAYAFISTKTGYLFDWPILKLTWTRFKHDWIKRYKIPPAHNNGYDTLSVAIPTNELLGAISNTRMVQP